MSNTNTKVTGYIVQGYVFMAEESSLKLSEKPEFDESSSEVVVTQSVAEEDILPINNNVIQTINYQINSGGMRI